VLLRENSTHAFFPTSLLPKVLSHAYYSMCDTGYHRKKIIIPQSKISCLYSIVCSLVMSFKDIQQG
jgi:hypothetical protein